MKISAFEGPAGYGKSFALLHEMEGNLSLDETDALKRILALTFMHGSRRRLDAMLRKKTTLKGLFEATTIDSFAWRICQRWQSLALHLGQKVPDAAAYEETCALAVLLLSEEIVQAWLRNSYHTVIVDEAQDLSRIRLAILEALAPIVRLLIAYDEFQCLDPSLRPVPITEWAPSDYSVTTLTQPRRTNSSGLLAASNAIRAGHSVSVDGGDFSIKSAPCRSGAPPVLAATLLGWHIRGNRGSFAILTPSRTKFVSDTISLLGAQAVGRAKKVGPYKVTWESSERDAILNLQATFSPAAEFTFQDALNELSRHASSVSASTVAAWVRRRHRVAGTEMFSRAELFEQLARAESYQRRYLPLTSSSLLAMTIHQAKNREFDHVVVFWPYQVSGDSEQQRRLLYNAVTRARKSCLVILQDPSMQSRSPFAPGE